MPLYVVVDAANGKRLRESTNKEDLRVSDPLEEKAIESGTLKREDAVGRYVDEFEELIEFPDDNDGLDERVKTWDPKTRTRIDTPPPPVEKVPVDPELEIVLAFRGVFTAEQLRMIRQMVAVVAPDAVEE